jgi:hypothetical protein
VRLSRAGWEQRYGWDESPESDGGDSEDVGVELPEDWRNPVNMGRVNESTQIMRLKNRHL